jgi:short subunit dehydrogenase-like uncharacterized protein
MQSRDYDVILYGASGFTGKQTAQYFAQHAPPGLRWAIAGRNRAKLEAVKQALGEPARRLEVLIAESHDSAAVDALVARTRVLLTTAGPFALYGTALVDACVRWQTHYVDITGETTWVKTLIERYQQQAAADGTRIIPFCGFDSVPSDLGTYLLVRYLRQHLHTNCHSVRAYHQLRGGVNGGTLATAFNVYESGLAAQVRDPFLLNPPGEHSREQVRKNQDPVAPHFDADTKSWVGPFVMGPINTRVVRRSAALAAAWGESYGVDFSYQEYLKFKGPLGWALAAGMSAGGALFELALQSPLRPALKTFVPAPGSGPSERTMNEGWFRCELVAETSDGRKVRGSISDKGDPGNRATVKFLCEAALCLALQETQLPGGAERGGLLTPATGLGDVYADRLRQAGVQIELGLPG